MGPPPGGAAPPPTTYCKGQELLAALDVGSHSGVFGIAYSIITLGGTFKGVGIDPRTWGQLIGKGLEDGHATAFMIDVTGKTFTMTGMGDAWVFYGGALDKDSWARVTDHATTYVYYTTGDDLVAKFNTVRAKLEKEETSYSVWKPNTPLTSRYENCISSTHYVVYEMGLGYWLATKGLWVPSFSNYLTWMATLTSSWKYRKFIARNTHMP